MFPSTLDSSIIMFDPQQSFIKGEVVQQSMFTVSYNTEASRKASETLVQIRSVFSLVLILSHCHEVSAGSLNDWRSSTLPFSAAVALLLNTS